MEEDVAGEGDLDGKESSPGAGLAAKSGVGMVSLMGGSDREGRVCGRLLYL